jgi:hypothetical protein
MTVQKHKLTRNVSVSAVALIESTGSSQKSKHPNRQAVFWVILTVFHFIIFLITADAFGEKDGDAARKSIAINGVMPGVILPPLSLQAKIAGFFGSFKFSAPALTAGPSNIQNISRRDKLSVSSRDEQSGSSRDDQSISGESVSDV